MLSEIAGHTVLFTVSCCRLPSCTESAFCSWSRFIWFRIFNWVIEPEPYFCCICHFGSLMFTWPLIFSASYTKFFGCNEKDRTKGKGVHPFWKTCCFSCVIDRLQMTWISQVQENTVEAVSILNSWNYSYFYIYSHVCISFMLMFYW